MGQGIEWNPIAKQTRCWRLKWPQRLRLFLEAKYSKSLDKVDESVDALLRGEEEKQEDVKDEDMGDAEAIKEEADDVERDFMSSRTFKGAKPGFLQDRLQGHRVLPRRGARPEEGAGCQARA